MRAKDLPARAVRRKGSCQTLAYPRDVCRSSLSSKSHQAHHRSPYPSVLKAAVPGGTWHWQSQELAGRANRDTLRSFHDKLARPLSAWSRPAQLARFSASPSEFWRSALCLQTASRVEAAVQWQPRAHFPKAYIHIRLKELV